MALCWPATPSEVKFAADSLLEEAVSSELVSEAKFPASWENTGNFIRLGLRVRLLARLREQIQWLTTQFPTHRNREFISA